MPGSEGNAVSVVYLGQFPPPYGGVTVKNALLYKALCERIKVEKMPFRDARTFAIVKRLLISKEEQFIVAFGNSKLQKALLCFLAAIRPSVLKRCTLIVMGGVFASKVHESVLYHKACLNLKRIYVETEGMASESSSIGLRNVSVYPNCRQRLSRTEETGNVFETYGAGTHGKLKCVFFSLVSPDKGIDLVLDAAKSLRDVDFYVYGRIEQGYDGFSEIVDELANVQYMGVFDSANGDVVSELNKYDLHLFPSRWPNEGVPGVLVETKMAAVPSIVSAICYNAELVVDGVEGLVLEENTAEALTQAIASLDLDRDRLDAMKAASLKSAERFYIDRYIDWLVADLNDEDGKVIA